MVSKFVFCLCFLFLWSTGFSQKKDVIDYEDVRSWPTVSTLGLISNDGRFIAYGIENYPKGSATFCVREVDDSWKQELANVSGNGAVFSSNSKFLLFGCGVDSLAVLSLASRKITYISFVVKWSLIGKGTDEHLIYLVKDSSGRKRMYVKKLIDHVVLEIDKVKEYFTSKKTACVIARMDNDTSLCWFNTHTQKRCDINVSDNIGQIVLGNDADYICFSTKRKNGLLDLYFYNTKFRQYKSLASRLPVYSDSAILSGIDHFSSDDRSLFIKLRRPLVSLPPIKKQTGVCIWNSFDKDEPVFKFSKDLPSSFENRDYLAVISVQTMDIFRIEVADTIAEPIAGKSNDFYFRSKRGDEADGYLELISGSGNIRKVVKGLLKDSISFIRVSPSGKYLVYYDRKLRAHCSYSIYTSNVRKLTAGLDCQWEIAGDEGGVSAVPDYMGWVEVGGQEKVYTADANDIWLLDPSGMAAPLCVTRQIGHRRNIVFSLVNETFGVLDSMDDILIAAFNRATKDMAFAIVKPGNLIDSSGLKFQPYFFCGTRGMDVSEMGVSFLPVKSGNSSRFLVRKMAVDQSPNFYITEDFLTYQLMSGVWPEKDFMWMKADLLNWQVDNGRDVQGILYRPKDFDSSRKYPVIINFYEKQSDGLNLFHQPGIMVGNINVPWFVSRGYLVFKCDIHYKVGNPGLSAFDCVNSAADLLTSYSFIDNRKMALQGHSFGGYETNVIVTQTTRFAAAISFAGLSDLVSFYGDYRPAFRIPLQKHVESQQIRMNGSLWDIPQSYISNSPIWKANKVNTPLLLVHNLNDGNVPFNQSTAFFMAMRRCEKPAWMLQYDKSAHTIRNSVDGLDLTLKVTEFFDYFLKGGILPDWMKPNRSL